MPATVSQEYTDALAEGEEWVEVEAKGKDFAPTHDWKASDTVIGLYNGERTVPVKGEPRTIHSFTTGDGELDVWGTAILDSRLDGLAGNRVKVVKTGLKITTKSGRRADDFVVHVARSALRK